MRTVPKETGITLSEPTKLYQKSIKHEITCSDYNPYLSVSQQLERSKVTVFTRIPEINEKRYIKFQKESLKNALLAYKTFSDEADLENCVKAKQYISYVKNLKVEEVDELKVVTYTKVTITVDNYYQGSGVNHIPYKKFKILDRVRKEVFYYIDRVDEPTVTETEHSYISTSVSIEDAPTFNLTIIQG